ncbi:TPA: hypothetical protein ACRZ4F_001567 [Vibrio harveyi]
MNDDQDLINTTSTEVADQVEKFVKREGVKLTLTILPMPNDEEQQIYVDVRQDVFPTQNNDLANCLGSMLGEYIRATIPIVIPRITEQAALATGLYQRVDDGEKHEAVKPSKSDSLH